MGNLADYEVAAAKGRKLACISQAFVDDLRTRTVMEIIQEVDKYYQENPGNLATPVIEVVLGKLAKAAAAETPPGTTKK
jgi:hypothetical protein